MHNYSGQDSAGLSIGAYIAGKGYWVTPNVTDDSNNRDAANYNIGVEALADRTVWIGWRTVTGLEGGTYPGAITWTGAHVHSGAFTVSGVASFTNAAPVTFGHALTVSAGTTTLVALQVNGAATLAGGVALPAGSVLQLGDAVVHVGNDAYSSLRVATPAAGSLTVQLWKADLWVSPTQSGARTWTLDHPPGGAVVRATVRFPSPTAGNTLALSDGGNFVTLGMGLYKSVVVVFDGTAWDVEASHI